MHEEQKQAVPHVPLAKTDLRTLESILQGVIGYLRNTTLTPQTLQRIHTIEEIRGRLLFLHVGAERHAAIVTYADMYAIREAMITFVKMTRRIVPQSPQRDETLRCVDALRKHLEASLLS